MPRIRRLEIRGFRGIRQQVPLLLEGKSVLLFGENGTGKSSFVDALEKLFTGRVSTLDGRAQGLSSDQHGPHIRDGQYSTRIAITFDDTSSTVFDFRTSLPSLPPKQLTSLLPRVNVSTAGAPTVADTAGMLHSLLSRTITLWLPALNPLKVCGLVAAAYPPPSRLNS